MRFLLFLLLLGGCVFLPVESSRVPPTSPRPAPLEPVYREAVGVIHVHTTYSDGQLPAGPVARIAAEQGLDFLVLTDHNTLQAKRDGLEGFHGKTLVLAGSEVSSEGHYLALRVNEEVRGGMKFQPTVDAVAAQGGLGFLAHPLYKKARWEHSELAGFTGLEIYNAKEDILEESMPRLVFWTFLAGLEFRLPHWIDRPDRNLQLWDDYLARGERVVGIGSPDAHGLRRFGLRLGSYQTLFKLVRNHLLIRGELTPKAVYEALEQGRLFVAHDLVGDARGFRFSAIAGEETRGVMGERVRWEPGLALRADLPADGTMFLFKDGRPYGEAVGRTGRFQVEGPGVYRLEVKRGRRPWIYTNPIYVIK